MYEIAEGLPLRIVWYMESPFNLTKYLFKSNHVWQHKFWGLLWEEFLCCSGGMKDVLICQFFSMAIGVFHA